MPTVHFVSRRFLRKIGLRLDPVGLGRPGRHRSSDGEGGAAAAVASASVLPGIVDESRPASNGGEYFDAAGLRETGGGGGGADGRPGSPPGRSRPEDDDFDRRRRPEPRRADVLTSSSARSSLPPPWPASASSEKDDVHVNPSDAALSQTDSRECTGAGIGGEGKEEQQHGPQCHHGMQDKSEEAERMEARDAAVDNNIHVARCDGSADGSGESTKPGPGGFSLVANPGNRDRNRTDLHAQGGGKSMSALSASLGRSSDGPAENGPKENRMIPLDAAHKRDTGHVDDSSTKSPEHLAGSLVPWSPLRPKRKKNSVSALSPVDDGLKGKRASRNLLDEVIDMDNRCEGDASLLKESSMELMGVPADNPVPWSRLRSKKKNLAPAPSLDDGRSKGERLAPIDFQRGLTDMDQFVESSDRGMGRTATVSNDAEGCANWAKTNRQGSTRPRELAEEARQHADSTKKRTTRTKNTFSEWVAELRAYKENHGHLNVRKCEDKSLAGFCASMRYARKNPGKGNGAKLTGIRIALLDAVGFEWSEQKRVVNNASKPFEDRVGDLMVFKEKHGHLSVTAKADKTLAKFCSMIRYTRKNPGKKTGMKLTDERIALLDAIGFDWDHVRKPRKSFEERVGDLKVYKEKHGHLNVTGKEDKSLAEFCRYVRYACKNPGKGIKLADDRIALLDAIGFEWTVQKRAVD